eukprot:3077941-Alexandrium_andersonii.AAC.1
MPNPPDEAPQGWILGPELTFTSLLRDSLFRPMRCVQMCSLINCVRHSAEGLPVGLDDIDFESQIQLESEATRR